MRIFPQDMDDHDLMFRAHKKLGKKVDVIGLISLKIHHGEELESMVNQLGGCQNLIIKIKYFSRTKMFLMK